MKPLTIALAAASLLLQSHAASAQTTPPGPAMRADVVASAGWLHTRQSELEYDRWVSEFGTVGGGAGWYWTDHLKTEIDAGVSSSANRYETHDVVISGRPGYAFARYTFSSRWIGIGQQYQFFRNAWFHPHLGAGVDLAWEETRREDETVQVFDPSTGRTITTVPRSSPRESELVARPFGEAGFKAYLSQRAFFRTDLRMTFRGGVDRVLLRFGFGVDF